MKTIVVNGQPRPTGAAEVAALARELSPAPETLLIELNGRALLRAEWERTPVAVGDRIEVLRIAAGG